jgi:hypothetical protein
MVEPRLSKRGGVFVVWAHDGCEDRRGVGGAACHRPHMIKACRELEDAKTADAPQTGLIPVNPVAPHGQRIDPPVSEASAPQQNPAAIAAAGPFEEMPVQCVAFHGFFGGMMAG